MDNKCFKIIDNSGFTVTTYAADEEKDVFEVLDSLGIEHSSYPDDYETEEIYISKRDSNEVVSIKDLMDAFAAEFGYDDAGCGMGDGRWFSPKRVLEFMDKYADDNSMI